MKRVRIEMEVSYFQARRIAADARERERAYAANANSTRETAQKTADAFASASLSKRAEDHDALSKTWRSIAQAFESN